MTDASFPVQARRTYAAANAALSNLSRSLARALAPEIRVNAVAPGFVETGFVWPADGTMRLHVAGRNHIGRTIEPEEVAAAVRFLCEAAGITGEEIVVDGGIARLGTRCASCSRNCWRWPTQARRPS